MEKGNDDRRSKESKKNVSREDDCEEAEQSSVEKRSKRKRDCGEEQSNMEKRTKRKNDVRTEEESNVDEEGNPKSKKSVRAVQVIRGRGPLALVLKKSSPKRVPGKSKKVDVCARPVRTCRGAVSKSKKVVEEEEEYNPEKSSRESIEPKRKRNQVVVAKSSKKLDEEFQHVTLMKSVRTRSSPRSLYNAIRGLNDCQRAAVVDMGLEGLLGFCCDGIVGKLGYYVVDNFSEVDMRLHLQKFSIPITRESVRDMLGLPLGSVRLEDLGSVDEEEEEGSWRLFKRIHHGKDNITPTDVLRYISNTKSDDWNFRLNFIMLFANILGESMQNGNCNMHVLSYIKMTTKISEIDWCSYIVDCLPRTKKSWKKENRNSKFSGPLTYLVLLYLDSVVCNDFQITRRRPASRSWTMEMMKQRESIEEDSGGFGFGDMQGIFVEEPVLSLCCAEVREKAAVVEEVQHKKTFEESITRIDGIIKNLEEAVYDAIVEFPQDFVIESFRTRCDAMFFKIISDKGSKKDVKMGSNEQAEVVGDALETMNVDDAVNEEVDVHGMIEKTIGCVNSMAGLCDFTPPSFNFGISHLSGENEKTSEHQQAENRGLDMLSNESCSAPEFIGLEGDTNVEVGKTVLEFPMQGQNQDLDGGVQKNIDVEGKQLKECQNEQEKEEEKIEDKAEEKEEEREEEKHQSKDEEKLEENKKGKEKINEGHAPDEKQKRKQKLGQDLKSPYRSRGVEIKKPLSVQEKKVSRALFAMNKEKFDIIYQSIDGFYAMRFTFETLLEGEYLSYDVIDLFAHILNHEEQFRSDDSVRRFFCSTQLLSYEQHMDKNTTDAMRFARFEKELLLCLRNEKESISMEGLDMIFMPILQKDHFWVIASNLKNPSFLVLDNSGVDAPFEDKYAGIPEKMHHCLVEYMRFVHHPKAEEMFNVKLERAEMNCRTVKNKVDCGIFTMRHMEVYKGQKIKSWDCGLGKEGKSQQTLLVRLRSKYACKLLLSELNVVKNKILEEGEEFARLPKDAQEEILADAFENIKVRLAG